MKVLAGIAIFLLVCMMGIVTGLASGTQWGTDGCGVLVFSTFAIACVMSVLMAGTMMEK